jgi:hypothetical protein
MAHDWLYFVVLIIHYSCTLWGAASYSKAFIQHRFYIYLHYIIIRKPTLSGWGSCSFSQLWMRTGTKVVIDKTSWIAMKVLETNQDQPWTRLSSVIKPIASRDAFSFSASIKPQRENRA